MRRLFLLFIFSTIMCTIVACGAGAQQVPPQKQMPSTKSGDNRLASVLSFANAAIAKRETQVRLAKAPSPIASTVSPSSRRNRQAIGDPWEQAPFYSAPPGSTCLLHGNHDADPASYPQGSESNPTPPFYDCYIATFDSITAPIWDASPYGWNPGSNMSTPPFNCGGTTWTVDYGVNGAFPAPGLNLSVNPLTTGGSEDCHRADAPSLVITRDNSASQGSSTLVTLDGTFNLCDDLNCAAASELDLSAWVYASAPPPPCTAYSAAAYSAATSKGLDPNLLAAFAAQETGNPSIDDGSDIYQIGGPMLNGSGVCIDLCGEGPWQVDTLWHPTYTGGLNVNQNANFAAGLISGMYSYVSGQLGPGATQQQIIEGLGDYYNGGYGGFQNPANTSSQLWPDGSQSYGVGLWRHYQRIQDFKAACQSGDRG